jgi:hypothetical protein
MIIKDLKNENNIKSFTNSEIKRYNLIKLSLDGVRVACNNHNIQQGWIKSGLYPLNKEKVLENKRYINSM